MVAAIALTAFAALAQAQYKQPAPAAPAVNPNGPPVQLIPAQVNAPLQPQTDTSLDAAKRIPRAEAMKMVQQHKAVYIDVRSKEQYDIAHIPGAINIPLQELPNRWKDLPLGKYLITYCA
jgi:predicted sulfurtransferase